MKTKDLIYLSVSVAVFIALGVVVYTQFAPKSKTATKTISVEVVTPIKADFDEKALNQLLDLAQAKDFTPQIDIQSGLGNPKPFNPL